MRSLSLLRPFTGKKFKWKGYTGHPTLRNINGRTLAPYRKAVKSVLGRAIWHRDFNALLLMAEMNALLSGLPIVRQGSTRGHSAEMRAAYILAHIFKQRRDKPFAGKPRHPRKQAAFQILVRALAVECFQEWPFGATTPYKQHQVARQIANLLWSDYITLFGKRKKQRICFQGLGIGRHIYRMVSEKYSWWLRENKAKLLNTRWIRPSS